VKTITAYLNEALNKTTLDNRLLKKHGVTVDDLKKAITSCGMKIKNDPELYDAEISINVEVPDAKSAEKFADSYDLTELTDKEIKSVRMGLNMRERTWVAKLGDNLGLELCWLGAKSKTPDKNGIVRVVDVPKFNMADAKFFDMIR